MIVTKEEKLNLTVAFILIVICIIGICLTIKVSGAFENNRPNYETGQSKTE